jgi:nickel-type superoxide dismutase maturation protease
MATRRGRIRPLLLVGGALAGAALAGAGVARRHLDLVEVHGRSMAPTLLPGDWLIVESWSLLRRPPQQGELVLAADPRQRGRELIKRVAEVRDGMAELRGDANEESTDSRAFGMLPLAEIRWRVAARYWPPDRISAGLADQAAQRKETAATQPS